MFTISVHWKLHILRNLENIKQLYDKLYGEILNHHCKL